MLAIEALRKARATMDCDGTLLGGDCEFSLRAPSDHETFVGIHPGEWTIPRVHRTAASALLDGFSVDEITAAEEALA